MPLNGAIIKSYQFVFQADGVDLFSMQKLTLPEIEIEAVEHSVGNYSLKTAGRITTGVMTAEKLMLNSAIENNWAYNWFADAQSYLFGGQLPAGYKRDGRIILYQPDLTTILQQYDVEGCFVSKVTTADLDKTISDNLMETVEFQVDRLIKLGTAL